MGASNKKQPLKIVKYILSESSVWLALTQNEASIYVSFLLEFKKKQSSNALNERLM